MIATFTILLYCLQLIYNVYTFFFFIDIVPALPEGWPEFKNKLWRRRSCELVKSTSSCVRKAVSHLHLLQNLLETYYKPACSDRANISRESKFKSRSETIVTGGSISRDEDESRLRSATLDDVESLEGYTSRGNKLRWLLSSDSVGDYTKEDELDRMLESSASGAVLEVCLYLHFQLQSSVIHAVLYAGGNVRVWEQKS